MLAPSLASRSHQRGAGFWGLLFNLAVFGFAALVIIKTLPLYLNELKVRKAVRGVAEELRLNGDGADGFLLKQALERRWDIEDVKVLSVQDVKLVNLPRGRALTYDYPAEVNLFYNVSVVVRFHDSVSLRSAS